METIGSQLGGTEPRHARRSGTADRVRAFIETGFRGFPWKIDVTDWLGNEYSVGLNEPHFSGEALRVHMHTEAAGKDLLRLDGLRFIERFVEGDVDLEGNLYLLPYVNTQGSFELKPWHLAARVLDIAAFQNVRRAKVSVQSHYDIPQEALNVYLDRRYMSYSCAMFERPHDLDRDELLRIGEGQKDDWDSLEKAQWRKFKDAIDYIDPKPTDEVLDIGCGYGGQLEVALERFKMKKIVGWTHSKNQVTEGRRLLERFDPSTYELNQGDYREDHRVYDHLTSTGMISHVGPRGLVPYVKEVRKRIKKGGRYLHHSLMTAHQDLPLDFNVGITFNKKYVWPGFHWFTLGEHVRALETNGFQIEKVVNLSFHYAKTTTAWYERMMANEAIMLQNLGKPTLRAWQIFLAGITGAYLKRDVHVCRLYCVAT